MSTRRDFLAAGLFPFISFRGSAEIGGVRFKLIKHGTDRRRYIWIHGDETTAGTLLKAHMKTVEGRAFLIENTERNVAIGGGKLDPNRMFSRAGADQNLRKLNPGWSTEQVNHVLDQLDDDREKFLRRVLPKKGGVLLALHNNSENYSVQDEVPISDAVSLNGGSHPHEFMLCTIRSDFEVLAGGAFNVVLQNSAPKEDDGSLSRLCASRGVRYINIEAALGNTEAQQRMLNWTENILS